MKHLPKVLIIAVLVVLVIGSSFFVIYPYFSNDPLFLPKNNNWQEAWGQFGDYIGSILNPLFSLTTIFVLLYTIVLQSKELHESTEQLKLQAEAFQKQNEVLEKQRFETTFFQMLTLFNEIINSIEATVLIPETIENPDGPPIELPTSHDSDTKEIKGRNCFNEFYKRLEAIYHCNSYGKDEIKRINESYKWFYSEHQYELGHYFRMLYNILKFVKNSNISDKNFYTNLVRAQLSSQELLLLFYNALSDLGNEKLKPLIEEFALLKTVPKKELINLLSHPELYADTAYNIPVK